MNGSSGKKRQMPAGGMDSGRSSDGMPSGAMDGAMPKRAGSAAGAKKSSAARHDMPASMMTGGVESVLVELRVPAARISGAGAAGAAGAMQAAGLSVPGFQLDPSYEPVPLGATGAPGGGGQAVRSAASGSGTVIVRGTIEPGKRAELEAQPNVVKVWNDTPIAPFGRMLLEEDTRRLVAPMEGMATCPIGVCDCSPGTAKGTIGDVASYLGADQIWAGGYRGDSIVVGVVDGGITAQGRPISVGDSGHPGWPNKLIPRVIGGWPAGDWGTTGVAWGWHGNMCSTDVLGMAPNAQVYDIRISGGNGAISNALAGFQWAIDQYRANGTPQILTNSWGIFQESWDPGYATDPNHPFTRKVVEALDEGILVLFAAGNCGATCPDGRCGPDTGPGRSIWGANSHPRVITVGAVNKNEQFVGYSSQGPGALDPNKPDFCSVTHFEGFFDSDSGTSAATPIAAGVIALLKQASPGATQDQLKQALKNSAKDIGPAGFDQHSGAGIIGAKAAFDSLLRAPSASGPVVAWGANRLDAFVIGTDAALYHKWWDGANWGPSVTGYEYMGGTILGGAEVVAWGANRLDAFVIGTDAALYHKWWNGAAWGPSVTGYEYMGGTVLGQPKAVAWGPNRLDVFVVGTDSGLYHKWWDGANWGPSVTGYESLGGTILGSPRGRGLGPEPARRVRGRHRFGAVPQVVGRCELGAVGHRLRIAGRHDPRPAEGRGLGLEPARRVRDRHRLGAVPQVVGWSELGPVGHRLGIHGRHHSRQPRGGGVGPEPARRVRDRHRLRPLSQVVERRELGPVGHRLGIHGRHHSRQAARGGVGREPPRRVRRRHGLGPVPQVVGRRELGAVGDGL